MNEPVLIKEIIPGVVKQIVKNSEEIPVDDLIANVEEIYKQTPDSDF